MKQLYVAVILIMIGSYLAVAAPLVLQGQGGGNKRYYNTFSKFEPKGPLWSAQANYSSTATRQHAVTYNGSTWLALFNNTNQMPSDGNANWFKQVAKGDAGPTGPQGEPGAGFEADVDGRRGITLLANTVPFTGYSAGKNYIYYNTNGDLVQRKNGGSEEAIGTGTGGGSTFETKERDVLTNMSSGKMYFPKAFAKHTLPLVGANKTLDVFAQTSSAHISANSETGVIRQLGGITSDAGYTIRVPKGSLYKFVAKEAGYWEAFKLIGSDITQHIADFVASLSFTPSSKSFADTATGASSATQAFTVSNSGNATGNLGTFALYSTNADQFTLSDNTCGSTLAPAASCTMNVAFTPTTAGAKSANVGDGTLLAALTGTGTATSASFSDNFNRADENPLANGWTAVDTYGSMFLYSGKIRAVSDTVSAAKAPGAFNSNQFSQATTYVYSSDSRGVMTNVQGSAKTYYAFLRSGTDYKLWKSVDGTLTALGAVYSLPGGDAHITRLENNNGTLTPYIDGVPQSTRTDSAITGGVPGVIVFKANLDMDDFSCGDL